LPSSGHFERRGGLEKDKDHSVLDAVVQLKRLEEEGDSVYHEWVGGCSMARLTR
jgi:hypothetical protein